ncbi:hypothetical protein MMC30_003539 [Trapelia coarctata]|nr:hypothetical protein [Trapelia coarctata]
MSFDADTNGSEVIKHFASRVEGKTFVITGTSESGLGAETAITLASGKPKQIILAARTESKVTPVIEKIKSIDSAIDVVYIKLDLLDNASVRKAAEQIKGVADKIHGLINNAGVMGVRNYVKSKDGIESQFAANHVGHFLLTNLLIKEILAAGEEATVVNVASLGYQLAEANLEDPNFQDGKTYNGWRAYGQAKTANILFTIALGTRLRKKGVAVIAVHPGGNPLPPQTVKTLQQGAACVVLAALDPSLRDSAPCFMVENQIAMAKDYATDGGKAEQLWTLSEKLVGAKFDF